MQDNLARPLHEQAKAPQKHVSTRTKSKPKQKFRWGLLFFFTFCFALSMLLVTRYAAIAEVEKEIATAKKQYEQLESKNITKKVQIKQKINIGEVEKTAKEKLGMVKPGKNQIVNIQVPTEDSVQVLSSEKENRNFFAKAMQIAGNIVAYLH